MLTVATLFWKPNAGSRNFSSMYDRSWVLKLYRGFRRNLTVPFQFVVYTNQPLDYGAEDINSFYQVLLDNENPTYQDCIQPYEMTVDGPMILCGLDTIVTGNIDELAHYAENSDLLALPRDPYNPAQACNGVALVPQGHEWLWQDWDHRGNDMERCRKAPHVFIDDLFPGKVVSYKGAIEPRHNHLGDARLVYFHGEKKPHQLLNIPWVVNNWW